MEKLKRAAFFVLVGVAIAGVAATEDAMTVSQTLGSEPVAHGIGVAWEKGVLKVQKQAAPAER